ncbi:unnamed protein product [Leptosia nina]|uniref:Peptidase S1 domain-containing protein n=1 Tax=Leptosia nina TaxID=320188 RepID=A0AAV1JFF2_9NEOP
MIYSILLLHKLFYECNSYRTDLRIYGGEDADVRKFPFAVALEISYKRSKNTKYERFCSATALSPRWTLTASHCLNALPEITRGLKSAKPVVRYYSPDKKPLRKDIRTLIHPNYYENHKDYRVNNDIGFIQSDGIDISFYPRLSPVDYRTLYGQETTYLGYGLTYIRVGEENNTLKTMVAMITECDRTKVNGWPTICTVPKCGSVDLMRPGDSGGTVLHGSGVIAVHSAGIGWARVCKYNYAGIDVPVSPFIDWIASEIAKSS